MLLRKVERLDSVKPWQPFGNEEGATFYPIWEKITETFLPFNGSIFNFIIKEIEKFATTYHP